MAMSGLRFFRSNQRFRSSRVIMLTVPLSTKISHFTSVAPALIFLSFPIIKLINYICKSDNKMIHPLRDSVDTDRNGCVANDCLIKGEMV